MRLIDADALLDDCVFSSKDFEKVMREFIGDAPTIEPEQKGKWLSHYEYCKRKGYNPSGLIAFWWCNQCEQGAEHATNFCPNCGAKMEETEDV